MGSRGKTTAFLVAKVSRRTKKTQLGWYVPAGSLPMDTAPEQRKSPGNAGAFLRPYGRAFPPASLFCAAVAALSGSLLRPEAAITGQLASPPGTAPCRPV